MKTSSYTTGLDDSTSGRSLARWPANSLLLSNARARLRYQLDDPLVVRSGRGMIPTPRALALAATLQDALQTLKQALRSESFDPATTTRRFTLAMADAGQVSQVPKIGRLMAAEMPRASLRVVGIDTFLSWGGAASTDVDAAIGRFHDATPGIHATPLYPERGVLVARRGHLVARKRVTAAQLASLRHVDVELAPGRGYREIDESYARLGIRRTIAMVVPSFVAAAAAVAETDWVATLPVSLVEAFKAQFDLVALNGIAPVLQAPLNLIWPRKNARRPCRLRVSRAREASVAYGNERTTPPY